MDNQRQETVSDPKELFSSGRKTSEYVKERTKNLAQITEYLNQELKDLNILNQELVRRFFLGKMPAVTSECCFENLTHVFQY